MKTTVVYSLLLSIVLLYSCSKNITSYEAPEYIYKAPKKGVYEEIYYSKRVIPINPDDTMTIQKYSLVDTFTIVKIQKEKGVYVITVKNHMPYMVYDSIQKSCFEYSPLSLIVSLQVRKVKGLKKMEVGKNYKLTLNPCFVPDPIFPIMYGGPRERLYATYVFTKGRKIPFLKSALDVYTSPDLEGLYYINLE